jgi:hypothetical protein
MQSMEVQEIQEGDTSDWLANHRTKEGNDGEFGSSDMRVAYGEIASLGGG